MIRALFLDRDGVINEDGHYIYRREDFHFKDGIFEFCRAAQELGYLPIVVTNQSGIARGYYTEDDFLALTAWMTERFEEHGVHIRETFFCPYHPEKGIGKYRRDSLDRKPGPGMLLRAAEKYDLDLAGSLVIGDKESDMEAGRRAGVKTLLFLRGEYGGPGAAADVVEIGDLREGKIFLKKMK